MKEAICPLCAKPVGPEVSGAKVYHIACLEEHLRDVREAINESVPR